MTTGYGLHVLVLGVDLGLDQGLGRGPGGHCTVCVVRSISSVYRSSIERKKLVQIVDFLRKFSFDARWCAATTVGHKAIGCSIFG